MRLIILFLALVVSSKVFGCAYPYHVTSETIENLPVLAFFDESEDGIIFRLYFRETNNLLGFSGLTIDVVSENGVKEFYGELSISMNPKHDLKTADFTISEEKIAYSTITILAHEYDESQDGLYRHTCVFIYTVPLSVLREHFKENVFSLYTEKPDDVLLISKLKNKEFITNRRELSQQAAGGDATR